MACFLSDSRIIVKSSSSAEQANEKGNAVSRYHVFCSYRGTVNVVISFHRQCGSRYVVQKTDS